MTLPSWLEPVIADLQSWLKAVGAVEIVITKDKVEIKWP